MYTYKLTFFFILNEKILNCFSQYIQLVVLTKSLKGFD